MDSHVETKLLAYLDEELSDRERARVDDHLVACSHCAAELERLRALQQELDATFDTALMPVHLPAGADARIRDRLRERVSARTKPHPWLSLWRRRGLFAQALLAVLVLIFAFNTTHALRIPPPAAPHETLLLGQRRLSPGSQAALRIIVRSSTASPQPIQGAKVVVRVGRGPGVASTVYTGHTDERGAADAAFTVPKDLEGKASMVVETTSTQGADQITQPIIIARDYKLFLSSDKPAYRPGQTIHLRALSLEAANLQPAAGRQVTFTLSDPAGEQLKRETSSSDFGVAALDFSLPSNAPHGQYTLRAALGETVSERAITVGAYEPPDFRVTIETDRDFYAPGERVSGSIRARYFFGKPVAGGQVTLRGYTDKSRQRPAIVVQGQTNENGAFAFTYVSPPEFGQSATEQPALFNLEVEVVDTAEQREGIRRQIPIAAQPILINAIPESGLLKPGVENIIFIQTSYPDGKPAETALTATVDGEKHTLVTGPYGLAQLHCVPIGLSTQLDIHARGRQGAEGRAAFTFALDRAPQTLLLRVEQAAYEVGDTLRAETLAAGGENAAAPQIIYLDIVRAGQTIATLSAPVEDGRAVFALDLDERMFGTLELHAYSILADGSAVRDTRLALVDAPRQVAVTIAADQEQYRPGDTANLKFHTAVTATNQQNAQPVQSALGIGVVDESVYALEKLPPGFARAYFIMQQDLRERPGPGLDAPTLLNPEAKATPGQTTSEISEAQNAAARAAWAGVSGTEFTISEKSTAEQEGDSTARVALRAALSNQLSLLLILLPLLLSGVIVRGLKPTGVLGQALRRVGLGGLALLVASPLVALCVGGTLWLMWMVLGVSAPAIALLSVVALLVGLTIYGWRWRDARVQLTMGLLGAYLALGGLLIILAARGSDPAGVLLALITATFLLTVAALATLGQGLVLEGWTKPGWATTALALLLIPLTIYLPFIPGLSSDLTHTLGHPAIYAGPVGWLTGCGVSMPTEVSEVEEEPAEPTEAPVEEELPATQAPEATQEPLFPTPVPQPTATPASLPAEPPPLRQVFPETLYWSAQSLTDENGDLALALPLADNVASWRLTALASTREGEIGFATYDLVAFQDFFVELDLPKVITSNEEITAAVTLYNYLEQAQTIHLDPAPDEWYSLASPVETLTIPPNDVAVTRFSIRAERPGDHTLQVTAVGERMSDAIAQDVHVEEVLEE